MKNASKTTFVAALALTACLVAPVALTACGGANNENGDDNGELYTVTFDAGRGTLFGDRFYNTSVSKNQTVAEPSDEPICDGYVFIGWNVTGNEGDAMWNFDSDKVTNDTTLYAVWALECTVTFEAGSGAFAGGEDTYVVKVARNSKLTAPAVTPPNADYALESWYYLGAAWDFENGVVERDMTLTAKWGLTEENKTALAPFTYESGVNGYTITGVVDKASAVSLSIPSIVTEIASSAFSGCENLVTLNLPDGIKSIGQSAFENCAKLKSLTLPSELTAIEMYAFDGCASLESVDIPTNVREIGAYAFRNCSALQEIDLPSNVTEINVGVFSGCTSLENISLDKITSIGSEAFYNCTSLTDVVIPNGISFLPSRVFAGCTSLGSVTVPANCVSVDMNAFSDCSGLTSVTLHCETVGQGAFRNCTSLNEIVFGTEVRSIKGSAFYGCSALAEANIPNTVTELGSSAFGGCSGLCSVDVGDGISTLSSSIFSGCYSLADVTIGSGVTTIGVSAFENCISLLSIVIPSGVESVSRGAFTGCSRLVEIYSLTDASLSNAGLLYYTLSNKHTDISEPSIIERTSDGFAFCVFEGNYEQNESLFLLDYTGDEQTLVLPSDHSGESYRLFDYALAMNPQLTSVTISAGVTDIGSEILFGSDNVTSLTVASGNTALSSNANCVISVSDRKFVLGCKTSVIPTDGSVTAIGSNVFCHNATIENSEFNIPESVTTVEQDAFDGCVGIIRIVDHIQYVDKWAVSLDLIGTELVDLVLENGTVGIANGAFSSLRIYAARLYIRSVVFNVELKYVGNQAFYNCQNMLNVDMNDGLVSLGSSAFNQCAKLEEIDIPDSVQSIGTSCFNYCTALAYVKLPANLTVINSQMFERCTSLKSIVIPATVANIEHSAFSYCSALTVYYGGSSSEDWNKILINGDANAPIRNAVKYYYSDDAQSNDNHWHFGSDGKPTLEY